MAGIVANKVKHERRLKDLKGIEENDNLLHAEFNTNQKFKSTHKNLRRKYYKINKTEGLSGGTVFFYFGVGILSVGMLVTFVGLGDNGFRTIWLKLSGPGLVIVGTFLIFLRILSLTLPTRTITKRDSYAKHSESLIKKGIESSDSVFVETVSPNSKTIHEDFQMKALNFEQKFKIAKYEMKMKNKFLNEIDLDLHDDLGFGSHLTKEVGAGCLNEKNENPLRQSHQSKPLNLDDINTLSSTTLVAPVKVENVLRDNFIKVEESGLHKDGIVLTSSSFFEDKRTAIYNLSRVTNPNTI